MSQVVDEPKFPVTANEKCPGFVLGKVTVPRVVLLELRDALARVHLGVPPSDRLVEQVPEHRQFAVDGGVFGASGPTFEFVFLYQERRDCGEPPLSKECRQVFLGINVWRS
jgi:hypothetical protein